MRIAFLLLLLTAAILTPQVRAQSSHDALLAAASQARDLEFPSGPSSLSFFSAPRLALYKPEGSGPFPAIVLLHQCGGLRSATGNWQNMSMLTWAKEAVARGYVALVVDSLGPRSVDTVCMGSKGGVNFPQGVRDAFQAADHLRTLAFVDPHRIVFSGYSWGAMVGVLASGAAWGTALSKGERFRAVVAFYPGCFPIRPPTGRPYEIVNSDIDCPLLVLMGDQDSETPPSECTSRLQPIQAAGGPIEWHIYPDATHCWDCESLNGFRTTDFRGNAVEYRYRKDLTKDAANRMFTFFANVLAPQK